MKVNLEPKGVKQLEVYISDLEEQNQLLKKQLEAGKEQYNDLVDEKEELQEQLSIKILQLEEMKLSKRDYTQENILEAEKEQLNRLVNSCQEEIRRLKKQLENYKKLGFKHLQDKNNNLENQQKEFIEYLEDLIKQNETVVEVSKYGLPKNCSKLLIDFYKEILSKYKEIIGDVKSENK